MGGTGGGFSVFEPTPGYQQGVPSAHQFSATEYLTPTDNMLVAPGLTLPTAWNFNPAPAVITGSGTGRATPDVSANADPFTGYLLYFTFGDAPGNARGWLGRDQLRGAAAEWLDSGH